MKKNKKYWKKEYKALVELYDDLEDTLDQYMISNVFLQDQVDRLESELDKYKNPATTTSGSWNVGFNPIISKAKNSCPCGCKRS